MKKLLALCLLLTACDQITPPSHQEGKPHTTTGIVYYKDPRTNLCFVENQTYNSTPFADYSYTYVPCTPEVEKLITPEKK